jgi:hypothetical protein
MLLHFALLIAHTQQHQMNSDFLEGNNSSNE